MFSINSIRYLMQKFKESSEVKDLPRSGRVKSVGTSINFKRVRESGVERPGTSTRCHSQELDIRRISLDIILKKDLYLRPYKVHLSQELQPKDQESR